MRHSKGNPRFHNMRCLICERFSFKIICNKCFASFLTPTPKTRLIDDFKIYTFYSYSEIDFLLESKYHDIGSRIYPILARSAAKYFLPNFTLNESYKIYGVGIDAPIKRKKAYSHVACILKEFSSKITPLYTELKAQNNIKYAGQTLAFRKANKKLYRYGAGVKDLIIFDDIITSGTSMLEAREVIIKGGGNPLFGIALSDAKY